MIFKEFRYKPASAIKSLHFAVEVMCPKCGFDIDIWNGKDETACSFCGYRLFSHEKTVN